MSGGNSGTSNKIKAFWVAGGTIATLLIATLGFGEQLLDYLNKQTEKNKQIEKGSEPTPDPKTTVPTEKTQSAGTTGLPQQTPLKDNLEGRVGAYTLQTVVANNGNLLGAKESVVATYQTPDGKALFYLLWAFPSRYRAEQAKQTLTTQLTSKGCTPTGGFEVKSAQGNDLGSGASLLGPRTDAVPDKVVWTDNSILASVEAPQGLGHSQAFFVALYEQIEEEQA